MPMLITDPRVEDNPIVFANDSFLRLTGYDRDEVMGRNCRFLQGPDTDPNAVTAIRRAVNALDDLAIEILNYRKDGEPFWNALYMSPVKDETGELLFFFASQVDVTERKTAELALLEEKARIEDAVQARTEELQRALNDQTELVHEIDHRVKNNLQTILALIRMELNESDDRTRAESLLALRRRVESLAHVYRRVYRSGDRSGFDVARFLQEIASTEGTLAGLVQIDTDAAPVQIAYAVPVALIAAEFISIADRHALIAPRDKFRLTLKRVSDTHCRCCLTGQDGAAPVLESVSRSSRNFIEVLAPQLDASIDWSGKPAPNCICIDIPIDMQELGR